MYIHYWTAWVDDNGGVQFRNDIYGYDNVPGAQLPVVIAKNPRPEPSIEASPTLQPALPSDTQQNPQQQESSPSVVN